MSNNPVDFRIFMQLFIHHGYLKESKLQELLDKYESEQEMNSMIKLLNKEFESLQFEIRKGVDERQGFTIYSLVNCVNSELSNLAPCYTVVDIEILEFILHYTVLSKFGYTSNDNLYQEFRQNYSHQIIQESMSKLFNDYWVIKKKDKLYMSQRLIIELKHHIIETYPEDVKSCTVCKEICISGQLCNRCQTSFHNHCCNIYFLNNTKCPDCSENWKPMVDNQQAIEHNIG